ncbi:MAG: hypothetical protein KIB53_06820 [Paraclostridium bifermentans]|uniref:hypothetical protein n=1 Tax=Paraclostridium bifermentans TaxID=1490 RepID=UPI00241C68B8|nr:hypothetical protein [Paraclostridium bifermentans]MBS5953520.1 hypothetical protein [Paraclostridium bifermentans]
MSDKKKVTTSIDLNKDKVNEEKNQEFNFFQKHLTIWVAFCIIVGTLIRKFGFK